MTRRNARGPAAGAIEVRPLGASGLEVSRLGLGMAALGRPGYINLGHAADMEGHYSVLEMEARTHRVLDAAWAAGVRYFDVARSYGRAERFLGSWLLRGRAPGEATVGSKWGYVYTADWQVRAPVHEVKEHDVETLRRQWRESRALLGDYLDLYQIHSATPESGVLADDAILDTLAALRAEHGITIGLSVSGTSQVETLRRALRITRDGEPLFRVVQATWNVIEPSAGEALAEARAAGMGVIVKEALANGRLTERNQEAGLRAAQAPLRREATRLGVGMDAIALAAALAQPWADTVLSGAATPEQLASNLTALRLARDATLDLDALAPLREECGRYWATRARLSWN